MSITEPWKEPDPRYLRVKALHFPRHFQATHYDWEADRGFRLEVLGPGHFWLTLGQASGVSAIEAQPRGNEQDFQIWLKPEAPRWEPQHLSEKTVCCWLSRGPRPGPLLKPAPPNLVLWISQWMPSGTPCGGNDFFTAEQILHQWGRVGRRVRRLARWRKWLPW